MLRIIFVFLLLTATPARADLVRVEADVPLAAVWLIPNASNPGIDVQLVIGAGEYDATGPQGLAHVVEHLVYAQIDRTPAGGADGKRGVGAGHGGQGGAFATGAVTLYRTRTSPLELPSALAFVARALEPLEIDPQFLASEKRVVVQEFNLRMGGDPVRGALQTMKGGLYAGTPFERSTIGTPLAIVLATEARAKAFHAEHYVAANATLIVSGPVAADAVKAAVETAFGKARTGPANAREWRTLDPAAVLTGPKRRNNRFDVRNTNVDRVARVALSPWRMDEDSEPVRETVVLSFARNLLNSALPGSLRRPLQYDAFVARDLALSLASPMPGVLETTIIAAAESGTSPRRLSLALDAALREADRGLSDALFARLKRRMVRFQTRSLDQAPALGRTAISDLAAGGRIVTGRERLRLIQSVTKAEVEAVLAAIAKPARRSQTVLKGTRR